jgi:hypothetical protein
MDAPAPLTILHAAPRPESGNRRASASERAFAAIVAGLAAAPLLVAATLTPNPDGHGTHTQLGLPPCGWVLAFAKPCPTCGMTTAFTHMADGRLDLAFLAQPAGALLALLAAAVFWIALHTALTGSRALPAVLGGIRARHAVALLVVVLAGWFATLATFTPFPSASNRNSPAPLAH